MIPDSLGSAEHANISGSFSCRNDSMRTFGIRLESSSATWMSLNVCSWTEQAVNPSSATLISKRLSDLYEKIYVERRAQSRCTRKAACWCSTYPCSAPHTIGTIRYSDPRDTQTWYRNRMPHVRASQERYLLLARELLQQGFGIHGRNAIRTSRRQGRGSTMFKVRTVGRS